MHMPPRVRLHQHLPACTCTARLHSYSTDVRVHVIIAPDPHPKPPGADVTLTDVKEVLPLLRRNYEQNLSPAAIRGGGPLLGQGGTIWLDCWL